MVVQILIIKRVLSLSIEDSCACGIYHGSYPSSKVLIDALQKRNGCSDVCALMTFLFWGCSSYH
jgi:hypothetical protein